VRDCPRPERLEHRDELAADACAQKARIGVRRVERVRDRVPSDVRQDRGFSRPHERANEGRVPGGENGEPRGRRAAKEPHEHGFGAIVGVMGGRDERGARRDRRSEERRTPGVARARLQIPPRRHIHCRAGEGDAQPFRERARRAELGGGLLAEAVVHAVGDQTEGGRAAAAFVAQVRENVEEGHRIGASAHRDEDARARWERGARAREERAPRERHERRRVRRGHASSNSLQKTMSAARVARCSPVGYPCAHVSRTQSK
jgi:hypothetical protein